MLCQAAAVSVLSAQQKPSRQSALEAFSREDYDKASTEFRELLIVYPKDPLYKYYAGVCLVKLESDPQKAVEMLSQARQGSAVVRTVPSDVLFWLGRAQQLSGRYEDAIKSYNGFTEQYGKKAARDLGIPSFIQQCNEGKGKLTGEKPVAEVQQKKQSEEAAGIPAAVSKDKDTHEEKDNNTVTVPAEFDAILAEALIYQAKADSLNKAVESQKLKLEKTDTRGKAELKVKISENEKLAGTFQEKADQKYNEAQSLMNSRPFSGINVKEKDTLTGGKASLITGIHTDTSVHRTGRPLSETIAKIRTDTLASRKTGKQVQESINKDTSEVIQAKKEPPRTILKTEELYSVFEVRQAQPDPSQKISINEKAPQGLIYRIQVAVFRNPVASSYFKGIFPIYGYTVAGTDRTAYYAGMFRRIDDARKALLTVRQKGFRDAFIAALYGGKTISMERAAVLEKEWGKKPFIITREAEMVPADTIPPELCFRIEVTRSAKPLSEDAVDGMKRIAGTRGFDTEFLPNGTCIYLIGRFITYESAEEYADLLIRNGYRDAKVVARLGRKEVSVEKARQLFENPK